MVASPINRNAERREPRGSRAIKAARRVWQISPRIQQLGRAYMLAGLGSHIERNSLSSRPRAQRSRCRTCGSP